MRRLQTIRSATLDWHSHDAAYAALVLAGGYEEAGDHGRFRVEAGDVLTHDRFEAHVDRFPASGALVFNLPLPMGLSLTPGAARVTDPDVIVKLAERSKSEAAELLLAMIREQGSKYTDRPDVYRPKADRPSMDRAKADWPDLLAADLIQNPSLVLSRWAEDQRLAPWTVSTGFKRLFGLAPEAFRVRVRARHAWKFILATDEPLVQIALRSGFADQPHMTRCVKQVTGMGPRAWRADANRFKTARTPCD